MRSIDSRGHFVVLFLSINVGDNCDIQAIGFPKQHMSIEIVEMQGCYHKLFTA